MVFHTALILLPFQEWDLLKLAPDNYHLSSSQHNQCSHTWLGLTMKSGLSLFPATRMLTWVSLSAFSGVVTVVR